MHPDTLGHEEKHEIKSDDDDTESAILVRFPLLPHLFGHYNVTQQTHS